MTSAAFRFNQGASGPGAGVTGQGARVEILDAAAEFDHFAVLPVGGLKGSLRGVDIATPYAALLEPLEDRLRRVELSLCRFENVDQVMGQNILKRIPSHFVVMQEASECTRESPPR